jgi:hypothetical protein
VTLLPSARVLVRLAVVLLLIAAGAGIWEILASQSPTSPYHIGVLPGPVSQFRNTSTILALVTFATAWLMPWLAGARRETIDAVREPWLLVGLYHLGVLVTVGSFAYGATTGMHGVQIEDPRPDSQWLFGIRLVGYATLGLCLLDVARRILLRPPPRV